jgi:tRNA(His) guanylyltransferase
MHRIWRFGRVLICLATDSSLFDRRASKLISTIVSMRMFTAQYIFRWPMFIVDVKLDETKGLPSFDGRAVEYPATIKLKEYLCWRYVDCMSSIDRCRQTTASNKRVPY